MALFILLVAVTHAWQARMLSSAPFDPTVAGSCTTFIDVNNSDATPPQAPAAPPAPKKSQSCKVKATWSVDRTWYRGARGRVQIATAGSQHGVKEGYVLSVDWGPSVKLQARDVVGGVVASGYGAPTLMLRPTLASGLGTITMTLDLNDEAPLHVLETAPRFKCVRDPNAPDQHGLVDDVAWKRTARSDYAWMAKEFNRQYINSHGKVRACVCVHPHPDSVLTHSTTPLLTMI